MGYGDHWQQAQDAARTRRRAASAPTIAPRSCCSARTPKRTCAPPPTARGSRRRSTRPRSTSGATRYGPALKLAESILSRSPLKRREAVLISDFQKSGWSGSEDVRFPEGMTLTHGRRSRRRARRTSSVPSVTFARASFSGQERITVTAGLSNKGDEPLKDVPVTLTIDGHEIQTERATVARARVGVGDVHAVHARRARTCAASVRAGTDPLPADNTFHFVLAPSEPVSLADRRQRRSRRRRACSCSKALSIGTTPAFQVDVTSASRVTPAAFDKRAVVILNDTMFPPAGGGGALKRFVERGGGLLVVAGDRTTWPQGEAELLPGTLGATVDRTTGRSGSLGYLDYSHPVFEVFKAPRSGDFSAAHVFRYRALADRRRPTASSRASTMARWRRRSRRSAPAASIVWTHDARRLVDRHRASSRSSCRSCISWCATWRTTSSRRRGSRSARCSISTARAEGARATASSSRRRASGSRSRAPAKATKGCSS